MQNLLNRLTSSIPRELLRTIHSSEFKCRGGKIRVVVHRQEYEPRIGYLFRNSSGGIQALQERHREIRNNYIWPESDGFLHDDPTVRAAMLPPSLRDFLVVRKSSGA
jgi:hypothetical protein